MSSEIQRVYIQIISLDRISSKDVLLNICVVIRSIQQQKMSLVNIIHLKICNFGLFLISLYVIVPKKRARKGAF